MNFLRHRSQDPTTHCCYRGGHGRGSGFLLFFLRLLCDTGQDVIVFRRGGDGGGVGGGGLDVGGGSGAASTHPNAIRPGRPLAGPGQEEPGRRCSCSSRGRRIAVRVSQSRARPKICQFQILHYLSACPPNFEVQQISRLSVVEAGASGLR